MDFYKKCLSSHEFLFLGSAPRTALGLSSPGAGIECPICYEKAVDDFLILRCGHCICKGCCTRLWADPDVAYTMMELALKVTCPLCRAVMVQQPPIFPFRPPLSVVPSLCTRKPVAAGTRKLTAFRPPAPQPCHPAFTIRKVPPKPSMLLRMLYRVSPSLSDSGNSSGSYSGTRLVPSPSAGEVALGSHAMFVASAA